VVGLYELSMQDAPLEPGVLKSSHMIARSTGECDSVITSSCVAVKLLLMLYS
jgi:hypothetical protein